MKNLMLMSLLIAGTAFAADTPADMRGMARIFSKGAVVEVAAHSQDLPDPSFATHWQITVFSDDPAVFNLLTARTASQIRTSATSKGTMTIDATSWGYIEFFPADGSVQTFMKSSAPSSEVRSQFITVTRVGDTVQILIDEPR